MVFQMLHDWFGYDVLAHFGARNVSDTVLWLTALFLSPFLKMGAVRAGGGFYMKMGAQEWSATGGGFYQFLGIW